MGLWDKIGSVLSDGVDWLLDKGAKALKEFNPFASDEYKSGSYEEREQFEQTVRYIADDTQLDHEYRLEAQRVLAKIESYKHAEEMARIEGTVKITVAQIEATKEVVKSKIEHLGKVLDNASNNQSELLKTMQVIPDMKEALWEEWKLAKDNVSNTLEALNVYGTEINNLNIQSLIISKDISQIELDNNKKLIEPKVGNINMVEELVEPSNDNIILEALNSGFCAARADELGIDINSLVPIILEVIEGNDVDKGIGNVSAKYGVHRSYVRQLLRCAVKDVLG